MANQKPSEKSAVPLVQQLAQWVSDFDFASIPSDVMQQTKLLVLDSIGCAFAANREHAFQRALRALGVQGGNPECAVIGSSLRLPVTHAVLANGIAIRELDLNDIYIGPGQTGHPSDNIAVALSVGERQKISGRDMLATVVLGYELYCRIQDLIISRGGWDHVSASALAAPAMAGRMMNLDLDQLANALALSAAHGNTLAAVRSGQLSNAKAMANGLVAQQAVLCTLLAAQGMTGPVAVFETRGGLNQTFFADADAAALLNPTDGHFRISDASIKAFPCVGTAQAMVAGVLQARVKMNDPLEQIQNIEVRMADIPFVRRQVEDEDRRRPTSRETADHSFFYLAAVALLDGELTLAQFGENRWLDSSVRSLMERITITTDPALNVYTPGSYPSLLQITGQDGEKRSVESFYPLGHPKNRMSASDVEAKFRGSTRAILSEAQQSKIISSVANLDNLLSVGELMSDLAAP